MTTTLLPLPAGLCLPGHAIALARGDDDDAAARRAARRALRAACGPGTAGWTLRRRAGRPRRVVPADGVAAPAISLTHRLGRAAALVAPAGWRVGVDVERAGAVLAAHARYFLHDDERAAAPDLDLAALWALKEAAWKALALGAATPLRALRLRFHDGAPCAVQLPGRAWPALALVAEPWPGWLVAATWIAPLAADAERAA